MKWRKMPLGWTNLNKKKTKTNEGSYTPYPYTYTFTPTFDINYQICPLYKTQHNTLSPFTLPFLKKKNTSRVHPFSGKTLLLILQRLRDGSVQRTRRRGGKIIHIGRNERRHEVVRDQPVVHQAEEQLINQEVEQHELVAVEHHMDQDVEQPAQRYMGGPYDLSVLTRYEVHVARRLWYGQKRGTKKHLKVPSHGKKLEDWVPPQLPPQVWDWLNGSGLSALQRSSMKIVDANLLSAFVERWHPETSSFHMPFGEMTITLYDVACLLHIPVRGDLYDQPSGLSEEAAARLVVDLLGVSYDVAKAETARNRGGYYRQEGLYDLFKKHRQTGMFDCGARASMMLLIGCTIFADKSFSLVDAKYLSLFRDLSNCGRFCWGAAALVTLYEYLGDGSMFTTKQLGGYATLLQCWIHEYFPTLGNRAENRISCDQPGGGFPRAMRWKYKQGTLKVDHIRRLIDDLTPSDVIWCPFQSHSRVVPFDKICLYSGCLRWYDTVIPYLPERCIRQFGYI